MRFFACILFLTCAVVGLIAADAPLFAADAPKTSSHKKSVVKAAPKKGTATASTARTAVPSSSKKRTAVARRPAGPPRQATPTAERYKEIQDALAAKGYLKGESTGVWDAQSVDALKRYQADQKQDPSGRITAASLIDLGLGPKTATLTSAPKAAEVPAAPHTEATAVPQP
jgi:hypothetical protein